LDFDETQRTLQVEALNEPIGLHQKNYTKLSHKKIMTLSQQIAGQEAAAYLTVRRYDGVTDAKEAARRVQEGFIPLISKLPGFISYYWVDEGDNVMVSVSVFATQAAEEESNHLAADFVKQHIAPLLPKPPQITAGKVVARSARK
jgi:hypothetical protein